MIPFWVLLLYANFTDCAYQPWRNTLPRRECIVWQAPEVQTPAFYWMNDPQVFDYPIHDFFEECF